MYKMNYLFILLVFLINVLSIYANDYFISILDNSDSGVEKKDAGNSYQTFFFLSEELQQDMGRNFPIKSLNINLEGDDEKPISIGSFDESTIFFNKTSNQLSVTYDIPANVKDGTYYLSFDGKAFNDNKIIGTSQNFIIGDDVEQSKFKILSPSENAIWLTKSENHTIVFTIPNTAGQANKFSVKLKKVDETEESYYPVFDSTSVQDSDEPIMSLLDEEGVLCHVKKARYLVWSPIPNVQTGRYKLELYGYKDGQMMTDENSFGSAYSGESEVFSLVRSEDWGGVVTNHSNHSFKISIINLLSVVFIYILYINH